MTKDARLALQAEKSGLPLPRGSASDLFDLLHADVHFLLVATRHILVLARGIRDMAKREADMKVRDDLIAAHNRFASRHLDAKAMRDLLEHFDAYAEGGGNLRSQLDDCALDWGPLAGTLADQREEGLLLLHGGMQINIQEVGESALRLAEEVYAVIEVDDPSWQVWPPSSR